MSVTISIEADGRVESRHNSGRVLWERQIDVGAWGDHDAPADLVISEAVKLFLDDVTDHVDEDSPGADGRGGSTAGDSEEKGSGAGDGA